MERMKSLTLLMFYLCLKTILLLTVLFTLSIVIFFLAGGAVNFVFTGDSYSRRFSAFDGYYIVNFEQPNQAEIDQISTMPGVDRILNPTYPWGSNLKENRRIN